jgi:hypothetical protein
MLGAVSYEFFACWSWKEHTREITSVCNYMFQLKISWTNFDEVLHEYCVIDGHSKLILLSKFPSLLENNMVMK